MQQLFILIVSLYGHAARVKISDDDIVRSNLKFKRQDKLILSDNGLTSQSIVSPKYQFSSTSIQCVQVTY